MAYSIFHNATANLNRTIQQIGLSNDTIEFLRYPESLPTVSVLLHVNSDDIEVPWGYRERCDEYSLNRKRINVEKLRRKHLSMGESQGGYASLTATGAWLKQKPIISTLGKTKGSTTVAAQESGDAVSIHAELFRGAGCRVVATSNFKGGDYVLPGLDIPSVRRFKHETRHLRADCCSDTTHNIVEHKAITVEELETLGVNLLVSAALEIQITAGNVGHAEASLNYDVCNWPTALEADAMSESTGTTVVPDILANDKGVTDQNFDWMQNDPRRYRALKRVSKQIGATIKAESRPPIGIPEQQSTSLRTAE